MRFLYGVIAMGLWVWFLDVATSGGVVVTDYQTILTTAIVVAGAMAGGK